MWLFKRKSKNSGIRANSVHIVDGVTEIDVRGQICPGYLLAINKAVDKLNKDMCARLLITYPPCGDDVKAWCNERKITYQGLEQQEGIGAISIQK